MKAAAKTGAVKVRAVVAATAGGTLNWAVLTTGQSPGAVVHTMIGDGSSKSARVECGSDGRLPFELTANAFPGTAWKLTLTREGESKPRYERDGVIDHNGLGHDRGTVDFS